jgi:hypothetical protein
MRNRDHLLLTGLALGLTAATGWGMIMIHGRGTWPDSWPKELEPLRESAESYGVGMGTQEEMYEIPFQDRDEFERLWPVIQTLKSKGGTLTLISMNQSRSWYRTDSPAVCIFDSANVALQVREGNEFRYVSMGPPWPDSARDENGNLSEYVAWDGEQWVATRPDGRFPGFLCRARVDLLLVVDGDVIDLNRIRLPEDTVIIDRRMLPPDPPCTRPAEVSDPSTQEAEAALEQYLNSDGSWLLPAPASRFHW